MKYYAIPILSDTLHMQQSYVMKLYMAQAECPSFFF